MLRVNTTVVAVITPEGEAVLADIDGSNVRVVIPDRGASSYDRAREAIQAASKARVPYLLHDADPLADVATAWIQRFDGHGSVGDLELAVTSTLARWRSNMIDLPDYYMLVDPEDFETTAQHWYMGFLANHSPTRIVAASADRSLADQLPRLRSGKWWPDMDQLLAGVEEVVPDKIGLLPRQPRVEDASDEEGNEDAKGIVVPSRRLES